MQPDLQELYLKSLAAISRPLVLQFCEVLRERRSEFGDDDSYKVTPAVEQELDRFVCEELWWNNRSSETALLKYFLSEAVTPQDVAAAIQRQGDNIDESWLSFAETLRYHLPLLCLVEAHRFLSGPS